jgi:hypothetical protein
VLTTTDLMAAWRERHKPEWSARGVGPSAEGYAFVVAEHRLGGRTSLTYGASLAPDRARALEARKAIRAQVDALVQELAPC